MCSPIVSSNVMRIYLSIIIIIISLSPPLSPSLSHLSIIYLSTIYSFIIYLSIHLSSIYLYFCIVFSIWWAVINWIFSFYGFVFFSWKNFVYILLLFHMYFFLLFFFSEHLLKGYCPFYNGSMLDFVSDILNLFIFINFFLTLSALGYLVSYHKFSDSKSTENS